MKMSDLLRFAALYLWRRKMRAILTVTGVIIGTTCIVLMFAIGLTNYQQFQESVMQNQDLTEIQINNYSMGRGSQSAGITDSTIASIAAIEHVKTVSPKISIPVMVEAGRYQAMLQLTGIDPAALKSEFKEGKIFSDTMPSIVLGANAVQQFTDPQNPPDYSNYESYMNYKPDIDWLNTQMSLTLGYNSKDNPDPNMPASKIYRASVSGIFKDAQDEQSYGAYISLDVAKQMLRENRKLAEQLGVSLNSYQSAVVQVDTLDNVEEVLEQVKQFGFETYSPTEWITQMQEEQSRQQGQLFAIGFISLIVSAIGIANTMYASILERRRDIGIMKVLGMRIRKIRLLFLAEAAFIGLIGGAIGIAVSYISAFIISSGGGDTMFLGMYFSAGMAIQIPAWLSLMALGISAGVGIISGVYPAHQATKTSPLEAMRNV
jgi:putative ABC transport system permease protein